MRRSPWSLAPGERGRKARSCGLSGGPLQSGPRLLGYTVWCLILTSPPPFSLSSPQEYVAYSHTGRIIPAIWFRYDLSPITVKYTERRQPLYRFITTVSGWGLLWAPALAPAGAGRNRVQPSGLGVQGAHRGLGLLGCLELSSEAHQCRWHFIKKILSSGNATKSMEFLSRALHGSIRCS